MTGYMDTLALGQGLRTRGLSGSELLEAMAGRDGTEAENTGAFPAHHAGDADAWERGLLLKVDGTPRKCLANVLHVLSEHPDWEGVIRLNTFTESVVKLSPPPVRQQDGRSTKGEWTENDTTRTVAWFHSIVGFEPTPNMVDQAVAAVAERHSWHPVREYLNALEWDGTERLESMLATYFGVRFDRPSAEMGKRWMISAVARVMHPGCQADSMLVLEGRQGAGKSTGLRALTGDPWFQDTGVAIGDKDSYQALKGVWVYEFGELDALKGRELTKVKSFLSSAVDHYRPSYGRRTRDFPRQSVFAGTTNEETYLLDRTGNRRFWPVRCGTIDVEAIRRDRDQLWAEALQLYRFGHRWHIDSAELGAEIAAQQADREVPDDWESLVLKWLADPSRQSRAHEGFTTAEVLTGALSFTPDRVNPSTTIRAGAVLRRLGFSRRQVRRGQERCWLYFPAESPADAENGTW